MGGRWVQGEGFRVGLACGWVGASTASCRLQAVEAGHYPLHMSEAVA